MIKVTNEVELKCETTNNLDSTGGLCKGTVLVQLGIIDYYNPIRLVYILK